MTTLELHDYKYSFESTENCTGQVTRDRRYSGACSHEISCN